MKKIRLMTDVPVGKYLTLSMLMELVVVDESEDNYIVELGFDKITISKFECDIITV